jgi:thiol-disulfide isomerase/thioredoxin
MAKRKNGKGWNAALVVLLISIALLLVYTWKISVAHETIFPSVKKEEVIEGPLTQEQINILNEKGEIVMRFFYSPTCPHCQRMEPIVNELEHEITNLVIDRINVLESCPNWGGNIAHIANICPRGVPQFIIYKENEEPITLIGEMPKENLESAII